MKTVSKVQDYKNWLKVDEAFLVNTDEKAYQAALERRKLEESRKTLEDRVSKLETNISEILDILRNRN